MGAKKTMITVRIRQVMTTKNTLRISDYHGRGLSSLSARVGELLMAEGVINLDRNERAKLVTKGRRLEYFTIAYNSLRD